MPYDPTDEKSRERNRAYQRKWYQANKQTQIERTKKYKDSRVAANRAIVFDRLKSGCADCPERDPVVLEFDHVRGEKRCNVARMMKWASEETLKAELDKCDVVCRNCHTKRTAKSQNWWKLLLDPIASD